jgi:hypothetical protein
VPEDTARDRRLLAIADLQQQMQREDYNVEVLRTERCDDRLHDRPHAGVRVRNVADDLRDDLVDLGRREVRKRTRECPVRVERVWAAEEDRKQLAEELKSV